MTAPGQDQILAPGRGRGLLDVLSRRYLLKLLVRKELRVRYHGSVLGLLWSYVKPAVQFVVFYFAIGVFLRLNRSVEDFPIYLFAGIVAVNYFGEAFGNATRSVVGNAPLVKKIYLPRELFPVASLWVAIVHLLPQMLVLLVGALIGGWRPRPVELAAGVLGFLVVSLLAAGLGLLFGAINVLFRDAENIVDLLVLVATWTSPVLYRWTDVRDVVPPWVLSLYLANPLTVAVELFHWCFWFPATTRTSELPPNLMTRGLVALLVCAGIVALGQLVFRRLEGRFAQEL